MSIQLVNGYACSNCSDVAQAKRGIDPHEGVGAPPKATALELSSEDVNSALDARAVQEPGDSADTRRKLDYSLFVDRLI